MEHTGPLLLDEYVDWRKKQRAAAATTTTATTIKAGK